MVKSWISILALLAPSLGSIQTLLDTFDSDGSGGLNETEVENYLEHLRGTDADHCSSASDLLAAANVAVGAETTTEEELASIVANSLPCLVDVYCAAEFSVEVDEELYTCGGHDHEDEEEDEDEHEEDEHDHEEEGTTLTAGINSFTCEASHEDEESEEGDYSSTTWARVLFITLGVCFLSLSGVILIIFGLDLAKIEENQLLEDALAFAFGILLFVTVVHLLPEGVENEGGSEDFGYYILYGVLIAAGTELLWPLFADLAFGPSVVTEQPSAKDNSKLTVDDDAKADPIEAPQTVVAQEPEWRKHGATIANICIGDFLHNFVDGAVIALAFASCNSVSLGTTVTVGIVAHELPQEISDFLVLVRCGLSYRSALIFNLLSSFSALVGAFIILAIGDISSVAQGRLLLSSSGILAFIVLTDIFPMIQSSIKSTSLLMRRVLFVALGLSLGVILRVTVEHEHCHVEEGDHEGHDH